ncbi:MAG: ArnT family glycosyltransferase [Thermoleophilia bacterium]
MSTGTLPPLPPLRPREPLAAPAEPPRASWWSRLRAQDADTPRWERPALAGLLLMTLLLYVWDLAREGWANTYYAAAVQAGTESWTALFWGSLDAGNAITVDKPPLSLWAMGVSARIFGLDSWSLLLPQAIAGVVSVWLLYVIVRRWASPAAALLSGAALALTPAAALMFRYDNPDAMLTLLLVAGAYALVRAMEHGSTRWIVAAGALVGLAFLTKSLQAFLVLPAFGLTYMVAAPGTLGRRAWQVLAGAGAMVVAGGWWVAIAELVPASSRPYIGGSETNSVLELIVGYNGLDRLSGDAAGGGGMGFSGAAGIGRLFNDQMGGQISWLLPLAAIGLAAGLWARRGAPRTDGRRALYLLFGAWAVVHGLVFSYMSGIVHPYYTVAMAPAVAALAGMGAVDMWAMRAVPATRWVAAAAVGATGLWSYTLLARTPDFAPWLRWVVLLATVGAAALLLVDVRRTTSRIAIAAAALGVVAVLAGPAAYAIQTAGSTHAGGNPTAGPVVADGTGFGGGGGRMGAGGPGGGGGTPPSGGGGTAPQGFPGGGTMPQGMPGGGTMPQGMPGGMAPPSGAAPSGAAPSGGGAMGAGGGATADAGLVSYLEANRGSARWMAAALGSGSAAPLQLASGEPVMAIGGFNGGDPAPTLEEFVALVESGELRFLVGGGGMGGGPGGDGAASEIVAWAQENGTLVDSSLTGGATVYDLAQVTAAAG